MKEEKQQTRQKNGKTVDYSLSRMIELGVSLKTTRSVYRGA